MGKKKLKKVASPSLKKTIGSNIKKVRQTLKHYPTAEVVAEQLGMSRVAYSHIENGKNHVNAVTLWALANLFGCEVSEFFPVGVEGYELSSKDIETIRSEEEGAAIYMAELFGKKQDN